MYLKKIFLDTFSMSDELSKHAVFSFWLFGGFSVSVLTLILRFMVRKLCMISIFLICWGLSHGQRYSLYLLNVWCIIDKSLFCSFWVSDSISVYWFLLVECYRVLLFTCRFSLNCWEGGVEVLNCNCRFAYFSFYLSGFFFFHNLHHHCLMHSLLEWLCLLDVLIFNIRWCCFICIFLLRNKIYILIFLSYFDWLYLFHPFVFNLCISLYLKWVSFRQHTNKSYFFSLTISVF